MVLLNYCLLILLVLGTLSSVHTFSISGVGRDTNLQDIQLKYIPVKLICRDTASIISLLTSIMRISNHQLNFACHFDPTYSGRYLCFGTILASIANSQGKVSGVED